MEQSPGPVVIVARSIAIEFVLARGKRVARTVSAGAGPGSPSPKPENCTYFRFDFPVQAAEGTLWRPSFSCGLYLIPGGKEAVHC